MLWLFLMTPRIETTTEEKHLASLTAVSHTSLQKEVRLELSKCRFGAQITETLGQVFDHTGPRPSDKHIKSMSKLNKPVSRDELVQFRRVVIFFTVFVDPLAKTGAPFYEVL